MTTLTKRQSRMLTQAAQRGAPSTQPTEPPTVQYVPLEQIRTDGGTQARDGLHDETVAEYATTWSDLARIQNGFSQIPPIVVFYDGESYWLADGFHRLAAYRRFLEHDPLTAAAKGLLARIEQGTRRDAVLYAAGANADHGLRRTAADKERAVLALLRDQEWSQWSDREIARRCKVSHDFVGAVADRNAITGRASSDRKTADGRTMNVSGIAAANEARAQPTDKQVAQMRERFYALGYEQFYASDAGWTVYHPRTKKANYKTWADVERDIARKEAAAAPRTCERCGGHWGAPGSMVTSEGRLCQNCAAARLSSGQPFGSESDRGAINRPDGSPIDAITRNMAAALESEFGIPVEIEEYRSTLPPAPGGWVIWQNDGEATIGIRHESGYRLIGQDAHVLIEEARAVDHFLVELHDGGWRVIYDPLCGPHLHAYTATHEHFDVIATHELPDLAFLAWRANVFDDDMPDDWPIELIKALYLAGENPIELAGHDMPLGELYHLAHLAQPTTTTTTTTTIARCECGAPATNKQNIGGVSAHRCGPCTDAAFAQEQADQAEAALTAPAPTAPKGRSDWWNCGRELKAFDHALNSGDQLRAARAAFALGIAVAGDATRLALAQAERGAELLEAEGLASLASVIRLLMSESEAAV